MTTDDTIEEKRVYSDKAGKVEVFVASELGVVAVDVSGDRVGEFGLDHRCTARAIAAEGDRVAVATDEDVDLAVAGGEFEPTGFGPAVAVGFHDGDLLAANEDGWVARYDPDRADEVDLTELDAAEADAAEKLAWQTLGHVETVRAIDGPLVAAADGVYRVGDDDLSHAGLDDVRDVAGRGVPLAATGESLYTLGNGWMDVLDGVFRSVSGDGFERAHAVAGTTVYAKVEDEWQEIDLPTDDPVVDVAYAPGATFVVTEAGTLIVDAGDSWQTQVLGIRGVAGLAVR